jgi:hypothetical protein
VGSIRESFPASSFYRYWLSEAKHNARTARRAAHALTIFCPIPPISGQLPAIPGFSKTLFNSGGQPLAGWATDVSRNRGYFGDEMLHWKMPVVNHTNGT